MYAFTARAPVTPFSLFDRLPGELSMTIQVRSSELERGEWVEISAWGHTPNPSPHRALNPTTAVIADGLNAVAQQLQCHNSFVFNI